MTTAHKAPRHAHKAPSSRRNRPGGSLAAPKRAKDPQAGTLSAYKARFGLVTLELHGAGRRYRFMVYRRLVPLKTGGTEKFIILMHRYSMAELYQRGHCAEGDDPRDACRRLAERNGWEGP